MPFLNRSTEPLPGLLTQWFMCGGGAKAPERILLLQIQFTEINTPILTLSSSQNFNFSTTLTTLPHLLIILTN